MIYLNELFGSLEYSVDVETEANVDHRDSEKIPGVTSSPGRVSTSSDHRAADPLLPVAFPSLAYLSLPGLTFLAFSSPSSYAMQVVSYLGRYSVTSGLRSLNHKANVIT